MAHSLRVHSWQSRQGGGAGREAELEALDTLRLQPGSRGWSGALALNPLLTVPWASSRNDTAQAMAGPLASLCQPSQTHPWVSR